MQWFRLWHEMIEDQKIGTLTDAQFRTWIEILCLASMAGNCGNTNLTVAEAEWKLRRNVSETFQELLNRGLVTLHKEKGRETISVTKWKKRQYQSDNVTERVQKHREKKRYSNDTGAFR